MTAIEIALLVVMLALGVSVGLLLRKKSPNSTYNRLDQELGDFRLSLYKELSELINNNDKNLQQNVNDSAKNTSDAINKIQQSLIDIKNTQSGLSNVEKTVKDFQDILLNKKSRGGFGEIELESILHDVFGEREEIVERQYSLPSGDKVDCIIRMPEPIGILPIDSKFPYDNYKRIYDVSLSQEERDKAKTLFAKDVKNHVDDIRKKYIIPNVTAAEAIMFVPSEAVFAEINASFPEVVRQAYQSKVWITSPTTLICLLETFSIVIKNKEVSDNAKMICEKLNELGVEFNRFRDRMNSLAQRNEQLHNEINDINITAGKITKKFNSLKSGKINFTAEEEE